MISALIRQPAAARGARANFAAARLQSPRPNATSLNHGLLSRANTRTVANTGASRTFSTASRHAAGAAARATARASPRLIASATALAALTLAWVVASPVFLDADADVSVADPTTGITLPRTVTVAGKSFRLLGLGARQVTILNLNVYVLGIYVPAATPLPSTVTEPEAILASDVVLYLTPTRNTGAAHLRDGFVRTLLDASKAATTPEEREQYLDDINAFKSVFPKSNVTKGQVFMFHHAPKDQQVTLVHDGQVQGTVASPWLGTALLRAYLREKKPISPKARASIVQGLADMATVVVPRA
ncbi:hypothetical protein AMAG_07516 [Allomyces macrogynus ATCC 38327]|uniref:Chalcone isomerase domain-containing protein n=1 Tax=Allomyces macrogynus (strain ATCC 38327) TaxID=578462 RepID=A0A0L0SII4_ALLM3|nr:hypothetical protein AMAG_07516 [Allomyces macrogynus ATCC 38327]|eukprot:KNE62282.1 hypothetical protein AMAG_07516 [Allomyces macrogynus ATCC 38327]